MLKSIDSEILPKFSKKKISCYCDCGNPNILSVQYNVLSRETPTCGKCALYKWIESGQRKFGKLTFNFDIGLIENVGRQKINWLCDCGKEKLLTLSTVISGNTTSCGCAYTSAFRNRKTIKHEVKTIDEWCNEIPELIRDGLPNKWSFRSRIKAQFRCSCGKSFKMTFWAYSPGRTKCGKCYESEVKSGLVIRNFKLVDSNVPDSIKSTSKHIFKCMKCGIQDEYVMRNIYLGKRNECRHCGVLNIDESMKFGRLRIKSPKKLRKYSTRKEVWVCDCGNEIKVLISNVISGNTKSCNDCRSNIYGWYKLHEHILKELKCPISIQEFPSGGIEILEDIKTTKSVFKALCFICGSEYAPRFEDVKLGKSLTCGCSSNRISSGHSDVMTFLKKYVDVECEFKIGKLKYDIVFNDLAIEYNGLFWHSKDSSKSRDIEKYKNALAYGYQIFSIYEDEWIDKRNIIESILLNRINHSKPYLSLRPTDVKISVINSNMADAFYESFHYIGGCRAKINYGITYQDKLIGCMSYKRPTRQSDYEWELVRMASDPKFRIHGIWSKLVKRFVSDYSPRSIVSFSDNRLFNGKIYEKLGFRYDGDVRPDYYWVRNGKRYHKSGLRKPFGDSRTETEIRISEGYRKIWDLGKKRWVLKR